MEIPVFVSENANNQGEFKEVRVVRSDDDANEYLANGWVLLNAGTSHTDSTGYQAKVHFILGKK